MVLTTRVPTHLTSLICSYYNKGRIHDSSTNAYEITLVFVLEESLARMQKSTSMVIDVDAFHKPIEL